MSLIDERTSELRNRMKEKGIDAYLITGTDPHQSEYVAPRWRTRAFISGFTGSAGTVVVTADEALLWVDSRYFIQGAAEIEGSCFKLMKQDTEGTPSVDEWLLENLSKGQVLATDSAAVSIESFGKYKSLYKGKGIKVEGCEDLLEGIWKDRPPVPSSPVREVPLEYAGYSREEKLGMVREVLSKKGADYTFIASIDDIAWLTNLRADDIKYNPVFMAFCYISKDRALLFTDLSRFSREIALSIGKSFEIFDYDEVDQVLPLIVKGKAYYDPQRISLRFAPIVDRRLPIKGIDITTTLKARKNQIELEGMRRSHVMDGVAFINFLSKLSRVPDGSLDEIAVSSLLEKERARLEGYLGPSFAPISGFAEHGAMCHYSATEESAKRIDRDGLLVLDTGSQFYYGMTDITRTLLFGNATEEQKRDYTLVLKGHLALSSQRFIEGTRGYQLDVLAKQFLWQNGESFFHGTGHGVGFNLNVHEGPMRISRAPVDVPLESGMVISDEPGLYKEGRHGIRIENLVAVRDDIETEAGKFLSFEVLTLVPYEKALIDITLLSDEEIGKINEYHKRIHDELAPLVDESATAYLEEATRAIGR